MLPSEARSTKRPEAVLPQFMRMPVVMHVTGLARSTIYRLIAEDRFPKPVQLTTRAVGWQRTDVESWSAARQTVDH